MLDRSRMAVDLRIPTKPGRITSGFHRPGGHNQWGGGGVDDEVIVVFVLCVCLPSFLPVCLLIVCLSACLPVLLTGGLPACRSAWLPACVCVLPVSLFACPRLTLFPSRLSRVATPVLVRHQSYRAGSACRPTVSRSCSSSTCSCRDPSPKRVAPLRWSCTGVFLWTA